VVGTIIGVAVLLFGASGVFGELQDSLDAIWQVKPKPGRGILGVVKTRFFSFAMVLGVAFLLLVSFLLSATINIAGKFIGDGLPGGVVLWDGVNVAISFGIITVLFALIYKVVPDVKIGWRDVWYGAEFTQVYPAGSARGSCRTTTPSRRGARRRPPRRRRLRPLPRPRPPRRPRANEGSSIRDPGIQPLHAIWPERGTSVRVSYPCSWRGVP
jgi:hypothetical protein